MTEQERPETGVDLGEGAPGLVSRTCEPSLRMTSRPRMFCAVVPHTTEWEPQALLPTIPPSVQRLWVEGSGPTRNPYGAATVLRSSSTTPGSTTA